MPAFVKLLIGLIALVIFGVASIHWFNNAGSAEQKIQVSVERALIDAGYEWARVDVDGQKITLYGEAPTQSSITEAVRIAKSAAGPGGPLVGGVTVLTATDARIIQPKKSAKPAASEEISKPILPIPDRFIWRADYDGHSLTLSGYAPSENSKRLLIEAAQREFKNKKLVDTMTLAQGAREGPWLLATSAGLKALSALEHGSIAAIDDKYTINGLAANTFQKKIARQLIATLPPPYVSAQSIDVQTPPPAPTPEPSPAPTPEEVAQHCQSDINQIMLGKQVSFASNRTTITSESRTTLLKIAEAVIGCAPPQLIIEGHTDATGPAVKNMNLSEARARAVKTFLIEQGVDDAILISKGLGETNPIATNATASGRSINRRIEFVVTTKSEG